MYTPQLRPPPSCLDTGHNPHMSFEPCQYLLQNKSVNAFANYIKEAQEKVRAALAKAKDNMAQYYNQHQTPAPEYQSIWMQRTFKPHVYPGISS